MLSGPPSAAVYEREHFKILTVLLAAMTVALIIPIEILFGDLRISPINCAVWVSQKNKGFQQIIGGQPVKKFPFLKVNIPYHIHYVS